MKKFILAFALLAGFVGVTQAGEYYTADGKKVEVKEADTLFGGRPRIGFEYEYEKSATSDNANTALAVMPGIQWKDGWINRAELYLEGNQDKMWSNGTTGNTTETKVGVRIRKDFILGNGFGGYVRGLVGRSMSNEDNYNYAYWEPALKYDFNKQWGMTASYRLIRSIDGTTGHDKNKFRIGPNWNIDDHHTIELRYVKAYAADGPSFFNFKNGQHKSDAYIFEYAYKF
jgi:hypothetical protein